MIDGVSVFHNRAVGQFRDADLSRRVLMESNAIFAHFGCEQRMTTFGALDHNLADLPLSADELLLELIRGWDYLFDRNRKRWRAS